MSKITTGELYQEWQDINSKLLTQIERQDEIITNQQGIIDRLNGPIDTQLIGSIVEKNFILDKPRTDRFFVFGDEAVVSNSVNHKSMDIANMSNINFRLVNDNEASQVHDITVALGIEGSEKLIIYDFGSLSAGSELDVMLTEFIDLEYPESIIQRLKRGMTTCKVYGWIPSNFDGNLNFWLTGGSF